MKECYSLDNLDNIRNIMRRNISKLKTLPLFHFSLHAKELFHSNFLAWLGEDPELRTLFIESIKAYDVEQTIIRSWGEDFAIKREFQDFDLLFTNQRTL